MQAVSQGRKHRRRPSSHLTNGRRRPRARQTNASTRSDGHVRQLSRLKNWGRPNSEPQPEDGRPEVTAFQKSTTRQWEGMGFVFRMAPQSSIVAGFDCMGAAGGETGPSHALTHRYERGG